MLPQVMGYLMSTVVHVLAPGYLDGNTVTRLITGTEAIRVPDTEMPSIQKFKFAYPLRLSSSNACYYIDHHT